MGDLRNTAKTEVTTCVTVADLIPGNPSALVTLKRTVNPQGIARHMTQKVFVQSSALAQRLFAEVRCGDEITLTLTTTWTEDSYETDVTDFVLPVRPGNGRRFAEDRYAAASS